MTIIKEISLKDFDFWGNAVKTRKKLTDDELDEIEEVLESNSWPLTETQLNDLFAFDTEAICDWLDISEEEWDAR